MKRIQVCSLVCGLFATAAFAQPIDTNDYDGKWTATIRAARGGERAGRVVIANFAGTWLEVAGKGARGNPCISRRAFPITVQESTADAFEFTVFSASVRSSCADLSMTLKPIDAKTLEGTTAQGDPVRLIRR